LTTWLSSLSLTILTLFLATEACSLEVNPSIMQLLTIQDPNRPSARYKEAKNKVGLVQPFMSGVAVL
jgi:hypothetical protein